jgi:hypothetical protein
MRRLSLRIFQQQLQPVNNLSGNKPQSKPKTQVEAQRKNLVAA